MNEKDHNKNRLRPIVSSEHLTSDEGWQMSEFEYGLIVAFYGFSSWMIRCMNAAGYTDFNPLDILILHNVNHRNREKRLSDICFVLKVEDSHTVNYSLKKLIKIDLVKGTKRGKEIHYSTTKAGIDACLEYGKIRNLCLVDPALATESNMDEFAHTAQILRSMSGLYDQASRAAASL